MPQFPINSQNQALESLRRLRTNPYKPEIDSSISDPTVQTQLLNQQRQRELEGRLAQESGGEDVGRLRSLLGIVNRDITASPLTAQMGEVQDYESKARAAQLAGFGGTNPIEEQARYIRSQEESKLRGPQDVARIQAQGELAKQQEASRGALGVAQEQQKGLAARYGAMQDLLQGGALAGGGQLRSLNPSTGAMSFAPQRQPSASLLTNVVRARQALEIEKGKGFLSRTQDKINRAQSVLDQALGQVFGSTPGSNEVKELAAHILSDPELSALPTSQLISHPKVQALADIDPNDPSTQSDIQLLDQLLSYGRGIAGSQGETPGQWNPPF